MFKLYIKKQEKQKDTLVACAITTRVFLLDYVSRFLLVL